MKKIIFLSLLLCFSASLFSQDVIVTIENDTIEAKILKVYESAVKYAFFDDQEGTSYFISKTKIKTITYENGMVESFEGAPANAAQSNVVANNKANGTANPEKVFKNVVRLKPLATIIAAAQGFFEIDVQYARYLTPKFGIPVEVDFFGAYGLGMGFSFMTGIEAVPATHRQKSGLFLNALAGVIVYEEAGFIANPNIGYQLVTKKGFVFNTAIGAMYNGLTNSVTARFSLDFGFAF